VRGATTERPPVGVDRRLRPSGWWFDALLVLGFAAITAALAAGWLYGLDDAVYEWCTAHRPAFFYWTARVFNFLGNGGPLTAICGVIALILAVRRRSLWPPALVAAAFVLTVIATMPLKIWTERAAPSSSTPSKVEIFNSALPPLEYDTSYPSGHLVNTIVWYGVLALLLAPWLSRTARMWLRVAPPVIVFITTVYLDFHWFTDSVAGVLLGVFLDRLLARVPWKL
jgi:membrane-associated phospholipid phosphatase